MKDKLPEWFKGEHYSEGGSVTNPFSGESYELTAIELSMYDFIKGAEYAIQIKGGPFSKDSAGIQKLMIKGLDWFRETNAKAYMVLFD